MSCLGERRNTTVGGSHSWRGGLFTKQLKKWVKAVFLVGCYGCIFHVTGNSAQLCQNFGISGGGVWTPQTPPLGMPLPSHTHTHTHTHSLVMCHTCSDAEDGYIPFNSVTLCLCYFLQKLAFAVWCINISEYAIQVRVHCSSRTVTNAKEVLQVHPDKELWGFKS